MASPSQQAQAEGQKLPQFSILVCGKTGIGKSSLINFILGDDVCEVRDPGEFDGADFQPTTKEVEDHVVDMNGVLVTIYDSPGLQDGTDNDEVYLADMYAKCRDVDLVFYCHDMPNPRWTDHEVNALHLFSAKFGPTFWNKAIFVLTKANLVQSAKPMTDEERKEYFLNFTVNSAKRFRAEVRKALQRTAQHAEAGEIQQRVDSIPVVPTGSDAVQVLPNEKHFIGDLWVSCLEQITDPHLCEIFMQATNVEERLVTQREIEREGHSLGITYEGLMSAGSSLTEYVAPLREFMKEKLPKRKPTKQLTSPSKTEPVHVRPTTQLPPQSSSQSSTPFSMQPIGQPTAVPKAEPRFQTYPHPSIQFSGTQQPAEPATVQRNIIYNVTHVHPPSQFSEPKSLTQNQKSSPKGPKYVIIVNNFQAECISTHLEKKTSECWAKLGAELGGVIGHGIPVIGGPAIGATGGAVIGGIIGWIRDRLAIAGKKYLAEH